MRNLCVKCGEIGGRWGEQFHTHHINTDHTDNRPENLITICASCHKREHLRHGPSIKKRIKLLVGNKRTRAIHKFNLKYGAFGGYAKLLKFASSKRVTLTVAGRHFGVTDTSIYYWVNRFGIKWVPVVEKINIYATPYSGNFYNDRKAASG
jgi:hypothetical protein